MKELYPYQKKAANQAYVYGNHKLLCDCGTGKTAIELAVINHRLKMGDIRNCLVIAPYSILWCAWEEDIHDFFPNLTYEIFWDEKMDNRRNAITNFKGQIGIVNYEVVVKCFDSLYGKFDQIVCDESTRFKGSRLKTQKGNQTLTKAIIRLGDAAKYRTMMTATPGFKPEDYWSQLRFSTPEYVDHNFYSFRNRFCYPIELGDTGMRFWKPDPFKTEELKQVIHYKAIRLRKKDCLDLPDKVFSVREIILPDKALALYREMVKENIIEVNNEKIVADFSVVLRQKLHQMADGIVMNHETKNTFQIHEAKLIELSHLINSIDGQIIIWANYKYDIKTISTKYKTLTYYGETKDKNESYDLFKRNKNRIIVCHPASAGHGITWTNCSTQIYYSLPESLELFIQSQDRTHRIGQINKCNYYILKAKKTVDEIIWKNLKENKDFQDELINFSKDNFKQRK